MASNPGAFTDTRTAPAAVEPPLLRLLNRLAPALLVPLAVFQLGYIYQGPNDALLEPWILRLSDPGLLARDWFANTIPHHPNFVHFLAWISRIIPLPAATLAIQLLALFFALWMTQRFSARLFSDWRVFYVAVFLFLRWGTEGLGGNSLWSDYPVPHNAALPFCLLAFYFSLSDRPIGAALAAAAATWIHVQLGPLTMLVLGVEMLLRWAFVQVGWSTSPEQSPPADKFPPARTLARIAAAGAIFVIAVAPTLLRQWSLYVSAPSPLSARQFLALHAILRQPHHLIPSSWAITDFYRFFLVVGIGALAVNWRDPAHRRVAAWCGIILALCVVGTVFVETIPVKLIIKMQLFRMTVFLKFFAVLFLARFLAAILDGKDWAQRIFALALLAIQNFLFIGACAAMIIALRRNRRWAWGLCVFGAGSAIGGALVSLTSSSHGLALPVAVAPRGIVIGLVSLALLAAVLWRRARLLPVALLALVVALRLATGMPYFTYDHPPVDEWYRFCLRVRASTPRDAVFITPPVLGGFQMFAQRAEVADFKCTPSIERDLIEWHRRMSDLAGVAELQCSGWPDCSSALAAGYSHLSERAFLALAQKYGAQYVVASGLGFPEVLRVGDFVLYRVRQ